MTDSMLTKAVIEWHAQKAAFVQGRLYQRTALGKYPRTQDQRLPLRVRFLHYFLKYTHLHNCV